MADACRIIAANLPKNGQRLDARTLAKWQELAQAAGNYVFVGLRGEYLTITAARTSFMNADGEECPVWYNEDAITNARVTLAEWSDISERGKAKDIEVLRDALCRAVHKCEVTFEACNGDTEAQVAEFREAYAELERAWQAAYDAAPFDVSWMMDRIGGCPIR